VDRLDLLIAEVEETPQEAEVLDLALHGETLPQLPVVTAGVTRCHLRGSREELCGQHTEEPHGCH